MIYSLSKTKASKLDSTYKYNDVVKNYIKENRVKSLKILKSRHIEGVFARNDFEELFSFSGSIKMASLSMLSFPNSDFVTKKKGRYFFKSCNGQKEYHFRGPRYIVALDPHYSVIQKLDILLEDINEVVTLLGHYKIDNKQFYSVSITLDYLKNALVTLFNSYIHQEKIGNFKINDSQYQINRAKLLEALQTSVYAFYLSLGDELNQKSLNNLLNCFSEIFLQSISDAIKTDFKNFKFSSKSLARPEASHPLLLISYALNICNKYKNIDYIFGLPSGSTEVSSLVYQISKNLYSNNNIKLFLVPISIHSIKDIGEVQEDSKNNANYNKIFPTFVCDKKRCIGIVIDDNSASGRTIEKINNLLSNHFIGLKIVCSVVEADLRRIEMNLSNGKDDCLCSHPDLFKHSTNILPISKLISPKFDLKEVQERRLLYQYYRNLQSNDLAKKIVLEVIADSIENRFEENCHLYNKENSIKVFKHTFLSNFYGVDFEYKGRKYSSVEQAYLRYKFNDQILQKLTTSQKKELNEILKIKGIGAAKDDFSKAFYDFSLPAGVLKRWSNKLKEWGLEDSNWDRKRLYIMTELLLLKYSDPRLMEDLLKTTGLYLIEGNEWNDTFWGVCNNRGRNYLGRIIMNIREKILNGQLR